MKTTKLLMLLLLSLFLISCKKVLPSEEEVSFNTYPVKKIFAWLESEKAKVGGDSARLVDLLKENLLTEEILVEKLSNSQLMLILPLKKDFKTTNITELPTYKQLILTVIDHVIVSGNIVEVIPKGEAGKPQVKLSGLFNKQAAGFNGIVSNLSIVGRFTSEDVYKDGKLYSTTQLISKARAKKSSDTIHISTFAMSLVTCLDWYIITTTYNSDGSVHSVTYEYIGTSCTGEVPCEFNRVITNTRSYFRSCGGGTGGGSGGGGGGTTDCAGVINGTAVDDPNCGCIGGITGFADCDAYNLARTDPEEFEFLTAAAINLTQLFNCFINIQNLGASYTLKLCSDIPVNNKPDWLIDENYNSGHTFLTLTKTNGSNSVSQSFGFYPQHHKISISNLPGPSEMRDNGLHEYDASIEITLSQSNFTWLIGAAQALAGTAYDLNNFNCTDYALQLFNAVSPNPIIVPDWYGPITNHNFGRTPNGLYKKLTQMTSNPNVSIGNKDAPTGNGLCY